MDNSGDRLDQDISNTNEKNDVDDTLPNQESLQYLSMLQKLTENRVSLSHFLDNSERTLVSSEVSQFNEDSINNSITTSNQLQECLENTSSTPTGKLQPIEYNDQQNKYAHLFISNTSDNNTNICDINEDLVEDSNCHTKAIGIQCSLKSLNSEDCQTRGTEYDPPDLSSKGIQCSLENHITSILEQTQSGRTRCSACLEKCYLSSRHGVCSVILCKSVEGQSKEDNGSEDNNSEKELVSMCKSNINLQKESNEILIENKENQYGEHSSTLLKNRRNNCEDICTSTPAITCSTRSESTQCEKDGLSAKIILEEENILNKSFVSDTESLTIQCSQKQNVCLLPDLLSIDQNNIRISDEICLKNITHNKPQTTGIQCSINNSDSKNYQTCGTQYNPPNRVAQGTQWSYQDCISDIPVSSTQPRTILKCSECLKACNTSSGHGVCCVISLQSTELLSKRQETCETAGTTHTGQNAQEQNICLQPYISSTSVGNTFNENLTDVSYNRVRTTGVQCSLTTLGSKNNEACDTEYDPQHHSSQGIQCSLGSNTDVNLPEQTQSGRTCCSDCRKKCNMSSRLGKCNVILPKPITPSLKRLGIRKVSTTNTQLETVCKCSDCLKKCNVLPKHKICTIISSQPMEHSVYVPKSDQPSLVSQGIQCSVDNHIRDNPAGRLSERIPVCTDCIKKCNIGSGCVICNIKSLSMQSSLHGTKSDPPDVESHGIQSSIDSNIQVNPGGRVSERIPVCSDCIDRCNRSAQHGVCSVIYSQSIGNSKQKKACEKNVVSMDHSITDLGIELPHCSKRNTSNEVLSYMESNKTLRTLQNKKRNSSSNSTARCSESNISRSEVIQLQEVAMDYSKQTVNLDKGCECTSPCTMKCIKQSIIQHQAKNNHVETCISNDSEDNTCISNDNAVLVNAQDNNVRTTGIQCTLKTVYSENNRSYGTQYDPPSILSQGIQCSLEDLSGDIPAQTEPEKILVCSNCIRRCNAEAGLGMCNVISSQSADISSKNNDKGGIQRKKKLLEGRSDIFSHGSHSRFAGQNLPRPEISQVSEDGCNNLPNLDSASRGLLLTRNDNRIRSVGESKDSSFPDTNTGAETRISRPEISQFSEDCCNNLPNLDSGSLELLSTKNDNRESKIVSGLNPVVVLHDILKNPSEDPCVIKYLSNCVNIQGIRSVGESKNSSFPDTNTGAETRISRSKSGQSKKCDIVSWKSPIKKKRLWNPSNEIVSVSDGNLSERDGPATKCAKQIRGRQKFRKLNFCN